MTSIEAAALPKAGPSEDRIVVAGMDGERGHVFSLLVKRSYTIVPGGVAKRAERAVPLAKADAFWGGGSPETTTIQVEGDIVPWKVRTDIVLVGKAHAPKGQPAAAFDCLLKVGAHAKMVRVIGDRVCQFRNGKLPEYTEPQPLAEIELRYDYAYGGLDAFSNPQLPFYYPRNHQGRGFVLANVRESVEGLKLPNFEDPADLLTPERLLVGELVRWNLQPLPQGFGWFQKTWYPRCSYAGSMPAFVDIRTPMREETMGLVPDGQAILARKFKLPAFDVRFNNGASLGLAVPYLKGGEPVSLRNLSPQGKLDFTLPEERPAVTMDLGQGAKELDVVLHSVCLRPEEGELDLVWRGAHPYPGLDWLPNMTRMDVEVR